MQARFLLSFLLTCLTLPALAADLGGLWAGQMTDLSGKKHDISLQLKVAGDIVTGTLTGGPPTGEEQPIVNGKLQREQLSFDVKVKGPGGEAILLSYKAKVAGSQMQGSQDSPMGTLEWEATKQ